MTIQDLTTFDRVTNTRTGDSGTVHLFKDPARGTKIFWDDGDVTVVAPNDSLLADLVRESEYHR